MSMSDVITSRWKFGHLNWRVRWLLVATAVMSLVTVAIYLLVPAATDISHFWGSVFVSWVGGVAIFWAVGLFTALASMTHPETESLGNRVRVLLGGQYGEELEIAKKLVVEALRPYIYLQSSVFTVLAHDTDSGLVHVKHDHSSEVRALLPEVSPHLLVNFSYANGTRSPKPWQQNELHYLRVGDENIVENLTFGETFSQNFAIAPKMGESVKVERSMSMWARTDERHSHRPSRYVREANLAVQNSLNVDLAVIVIAGQNRMAITVPPGEERAIGRYLGLDDRQLAYEIYLQPISTLSPHTTPSKPPPAPPQAPASGS